MLLNEANLANSSRRPSQVVYTLDMAIIGMQSHPQPRSVPVISLDLCLAWLK